MAYKITQKDLEIVVRQINEAAKAPKTAYTRYKSGKHKANIGHYYLDGAYGGWKLVRIVSEGGGIRDITPGYVPKKELYYQMQAFLSGLEAKKGRRNPGEAWHRGELQRAAKYATARDIGMIKTKLIKKAG